MKNKVRQGYRNISIQVIEGKRKISGWSVAGDDEKPVKNLNGISSRKVGYNGEISFIKDIHGYWRRTDSKIDVDFDNICAATHELIRKSVISDSCFLANFEKVPDWVHMAGIEPESRVSKVKFEQLIAGSGPSEILHRFIYLSDVQGLLTNIQRTSAQVCQVIGEFYGLLNDCRPYIYSKSERVGLRSSVSGDTALLHAHLETIFVRFRSLLDYMVKLAIEAERGDIDFSKIVKLKGASMQYADKKNLSMNNMIGTLFVNDQIIREVSSIRDRIVHDGHLDINARMYENFKRYRLVERFVLIPDMLDGRFEAYKNRANFYGKDRKINLELPGIFDVFYERMFATISNIKNNFIVKPTI